MSPSEGCKSALPQKNPCDCPDGRRNLVVCLDGTAQKFKKYKNTNVVELYRRLAKNPTQLTYYNSGIGTYAKPYWNFVTHWQRVAHKMIDRAIAWDFEKNIWDAYHWLVDCYEEGDHIFLFGFSRGAYQVRVLAAMIKIVGLLQKGNKQQIPYAYEIYTAGKKDAAEKFKATFSREKVGVHFIGAWDAVSSVGFTKTLPGADSPYLACYFRHALALDECRKKFKPEYVKDPDPMALPEDGPTEESSRGQQVKEVWFSGSHSDIGGENEQHDANYVDRKHPAFVWICYESLFAGLLLNASGIDWTEKSLLGQPTEPPPVWQLLGTQPRKILPHQATHISLAFCKKLYIPKATGPGGILYWADLVGSAGEETTANPADDREARRWSSSWLKSSLQKSVEVDIFTPSSAKEQKILSTIRKSELILPEGQEAKSTRSLKQVKNATSHLLQSLWKRDSRARDRIAGAVARLSETNSFLNIFRHRIDDTSVKLSVELLAELLTSCRVANREQRERDLERKIVKALLEGGGYARQKLAKEFVNLSAQTNQHLPAHWYEAVAVLAKHKDSRDELLHGDIATKLCIGDNNEAPPGVVLAMLKAIAELAKYDGPLGQLVMHGEAVRKVFVTALDYEHENVRSHAYTTIKDWAKYQNSGLTLITVELIEEVVAKLFSEVPLNSSALDVVLEVSKHHSMDQYGLNEDNIQTVWNVMRDDPCERYAGFIVQLSKSDPLRRPMLTSGNVQNILKLLQSEPKNTHQLTYMIVHEWIVYSDSRKAILNTGIINVLLSRLMAQCSEDIFEETTAIDKGSQGTTLWGDSGLEGVSNLDFVSQLSRPSPIYKIIIALCEHEDSLDELKKILNERMNDQERQDLIRVLTKMKEECGAILRELALKIIRNVDISIALAPMKGSPTKESLRTSPLAARTTYFRRLRLTTSQLREYDAYFRGLDSFSACLALILIFVASRAVY